MLSFAAGVGVSYVVIHLLPQIAHSQEVLRESFGWDSDSPFKYTIYVIVLLGFVISYIVFKIDEENIQNMEKRHPESLMSLRFWSDITFFAIYNAMIGYLVLYNVYSGVFHMFIFFFAYGLHFLMNDWGLRHHYQKLYDKIGRVVLAASLFLGGVLSVFIKFPYYIVVSFEAFIAGAMILNIIKFELPADNDGSIIGFVTGITSSCILFLML
jgi:hypothetical protein